MTAPTAGEPTEGVYEPRHYSSRYYVKRVTSNRDSNGIYGVVPHSSTQLLSANGYPRTPTCCLLLAAIGPCFSLPVLHVQVVSNTARGRVARGRGFQ